MDCSKYEAMPGELFNQNDDEKDVGKPRYTVLLRYSWPFTMQESVHVWMLKLTSRSLKREDISVTVS